MESAKWILYEENFKYKIGFCGDTLNSVAFANFTLSNIDTLSDTIEYKFNISYKNCDQIEFADNCHYFNRIGFINDTPKYLSSGDVISDLNPSEFERDGKLFTMTDSALQLYKQNNRTAFEQFILKHKSKVDKWLLSKVNQKQNIAY